MSQYFLHVSVEHYNVCNPAAYLHLHFGCGRCLFCTLQLSRLADIGIFMSFICLPEPHFLIYRLYLLHWRLVNGGLQLIFHFWHGHVRE